MTWLRTFWAEFIGLFVDDWAFALILLIWVGLFATPLRGAFGTLAGLVLFLGVAVLTLVFVLRQAKHERRGETNSGVQ